MPKLDGSVGQGAENRRHDVAVVQAALGKARGRDRKPYWPGPIDGDTPRHRKALGQCVLHKVRTGPHPLPATHGIVCSWVAGRGCGPVRFHSNGT